MEDEEVLAIIERTGRDRFKLIEVLVEVQELYNYLPREALDLVSEELNIPPLEVFKVANFYKAFSLEPRGRHIVTVCAGTACHVRGAATLLSELQSYLQLEPGKTTADGEFTLQAVNCLGACALGPIVVLDGVFHGHMNITRIKELLDRCTRKEMVR